MWVSELSDIIELGMNCCVHFEEYQGIQGANSLESLHSVGSEVPSGSGRKRMESWKGVGVVRGSGSSEGGPWAGPGVGGAWAGLGAVGGVRLGVAL